MVLPVLGLLQEAAVTQQTEWKDLKQGYVGLTLFICATVTVAGGFYWLGLKKILLMSNA